MSEIVHIIIDDDKPPPSSSSSSSSSTTTTTTTSSTTTTTNTPKFTDEEVSIICKSAEQGVKSLIANALDDNFNSDGRPWSLQFENKDLDLKVYNSETKGSPIKKFKAVCIVPFPPKYVQEFISDNNHRLIWDRNICDLTALIVKEEEKKKIILLRSATKKVGPIAGRDFIDTTCIMEYDDGSRVSGGAGINNIGFPSKIDNFVRGFNATGGGWYFQPIDDGVSTKVTYIIQCDLKGWFSAILINNVIGGSYLDFFTDLKKALHSKQANEKK